MLVWFKEGMVIGRMRIGCAEVGRVRCVKAPTVVLNARQLPPEHVEGSCPQRDRHKPWHTKHTAVIPKGQK